MLRIIPHLFRVTLHFHVDVSSVFENIGACSLTARIDFCPSFLGDAANIAIKKTINQSE